MSICELLKKEGRVLEQLGKSQNVEYALCLNLKDKEIHFIKGEKHTVSVPRKCDIILHNHPLTPYPSPADLKASERAIICIAHKGSISCYKDYTRICEDIPPIETEFSHHDVRYNLREIVKQLILIEEHYVKDPCADCITKHLLTIQALVEEGMRLNNAEKFMELLKKAKELTEKHLKAIKEGTIKEGMVQEVRQLRKEIFREVMGVFEHEHTHLKQKTWQGLPIKYDQWNWEKVKPHLPSQRHEVMQKYGSKCFLRPADLGFPICNIYGQLDCDGLRAAYVRARALITSAKKAGREDLAKQYEEISKKAREIATQVGCHWVAEEE